MSVSIVVSIIISAIGGLLLLFMPAALMITESTAASRKLKSIKFCIIAMLLAYLIAGFAAKSTTYYSDFGNHLLLYSGTNIDCRLLFKDTDGSIVLKGTIIVDGTDFGKNTRLKPGKFDVEGKDVYKFVMQKCISSDGRS